MELLTENVQSVHELTNEILDAVKRVCEFTLGYEECILMHRSVLLLPMMKIYA